MEKLTNLALEKAYAILSSECSPIGLMASPEGYPHVWARDSVITSLGALLAPGHELCLKRSLATLAEQQSELGAIPNNVSVATGRLDHTNAGSVDSNLWFILGHALQYRASGDIEFLRRQWPALEQALLWLRYQDSNGCGLLEIHDAADWADDVRHKLRIVLWVGPENDDEWVESCPGHTEWQHTLSQVAPVLIKRPFFLPYVAFRDFGDYCDVFGNLLAILFDVANPVQEKRILDYLHQVGIAEPYPVRILHPVIHPGNKDWREYYHNNNLNLPEQYHNGGIWPFVGGFYVAALVKAGRLDEARRQLEKLAEVNRLGVDEEWEFNEWCHGRTGQPMGYPHQAWSAGMYLFAYHCVATSTVPFFSTSAPAGTAYSANMDKVSARKS